MERKNKLEVVSTNKSRYILPSLLTLIGVCLGISSIKFAMDGNFVLCSFIFSRCCNIRWS
jgi:CDP-diacylglycerol--serine O-phosphatidyltransferase